MARVLITGSTSGLGLAAARDLLRQGHEVVLHARSSARVADLDIASSAVGVVIGDLASAAEIRHLAEQINAIGSIQTVIHNAAVYSEPTRGSTPEGHAGTVAVNVLAPYLLTAWIERPARLVYLTSDMHRSGSTTLDDLDWTARPWNGTQAYCDSKLHIIALTLALARRWPDTRVNAVDPGWVPTRMGGRSAPDDLELGHVTQTWLAVSDDPEASITGGYWHHQRQQRPAAVASEPKFQDALLEALEQLTDVRLP